MDQRCNTPKVFTFQHLRYWAHQGMVWIANEGTGEIRTEAPMAMRARAEAFFREAQRMGHGTGHYIGERNELLKACKELIEIVQLAESQGDPTDPRVAREQAKQGRRLVVSVSGLDIPRTSPQPRIILP